MGWTWKQICADPILRDLPYRVESDRWGNAVLPPLGDAIHSFRLSRIMLHLARLLPEGRALPVYPLQTAEGVKAIDVAWLSRARRLRRPPVADVAVLAPEICVEVAARHNQPGEIEARTQLYFQRGATECWVCDVKGRMSFYNPAERLNHSEICPSFPAVIEDPELES